MGRSFYDLDGTGSAATRVELETVRKTGMAFAIGQGWQAAACPVFGGHGLAGRLALIGVADWISEDPESQQGAGKEGTQTDGTSWRR